MGRIYVAGAAGAHPFVVLGGVMDSYTFTGRVAYPWYKKINPIWWFGNAAEQTVDQAPWFQPGWPHWQRWLIWNYFRNPLQNFRCFVIGVADRNYRVTGKAPVLTVQRNDLQPPQTWIQYSFIRLAIPLPFFSYCGAFTFYIGWQPSGIFGLKLTR